MKKIILSILNKLKNVAPNKIVPNETPEIVVHKKIIPDEYYSDSMQFKGIVVHHSLSKDGVTRDTDSIRKYHTSYRIDGNIVSKDVFYAKKDAGEKHYYELPWSDIGYHGLIEVVYNNVEFIKGRSWSSIGAHSGVKYNGKVFKDYNYYFGLCIIGNFDIEKPSQRIIDMAIKVCKELIMAYDISKDNIIGHREVFDRLGVPRQKSCPGALFDMDLIRSQL